LRGKLFGPGSSLTSLPAQSSPLVDGSVPLAGVGMSARHVSGELIGWNWIRHLWAWAG